MSRQGLFAMRYSALSLAFLHLVSSLAINPRAGVVVAPMWKRNGIDALQGPRLTGRGTPLLPLSPGDDQNLYFANITIGTPGQPVALQIDTGSTDIWVEVASSNACQNETNPCLGGTYDYSVSSTYEFVSNDFYMPYGDGTYAAGVYADETLNIGGVDVTSVQIGIGINATSNVGVMGVGLPATEGSPTVYPTLLDQMVSQGLINSRAYSLYLNDIEAQTGNILFGGVDTDKFFGTLSTLPINVNETGQASRFFITMTGLSLTAPDGLTAGIGSSNYYPFNVVLDSGSTLMYLPQNVAQAVADATGATYVARVNRYLFEDCSKQFTKGTLNFYFSGVAISVPYDQFIISKPLSDGTQICLLGIVPQSLDGLFILGDSFLRSAYVVYDLDNKQISIANAKFNSSSSNIQAISSGQNGVPSATLVANATTLLDDATPALTGTATGVGGVIPTSSGPSARSSAVGVRSMSSLAFGLSSFLCIALGAWMIV